MCSNFRSTDADNKILIKNVSENSEKQEQWERYTDIWPWTRMAHVSSVNANK